MCHADLVSPLPINGYATDATTPVDQNGFYTIVISDDMLRPEWVREGVVWLPWGDEKMVPKLIFLRNTLPNPDFNQAVQNALAKGCGFDFNFPIPPTQAIITQSGQCAQRVMGDYYPEAVWCDQSKFVSGGWQECFREADMPVTAKPEAR
jgi:hypothetical protein